MPTVRLGLLTLPLAGLLLTWAAIATSAFFDFTGARLGPEEVARASTSVGYFLSQFAGYLVGLTLLSVGVFASMSRKLWVWFLCSSKGVHREVASERPLFAA